MSDERFGKIEGLLEQLISIVGNLNLNQKKLENRMESMEKRMDAMEVKAEDRHKEIISRFQTMEMDQDFIRKNTARNERELEVLKRRF